ncbi:NACHT domain-containing protein [Mycobacterium colombiense]|uniref:NACHT domain-containing protein n=1 Tax=Mycobacterium colombiense TaxID=339268 RepID=UPI000AD741CF|nr:hypothetical protein [Mycobacterium colombiense]
MEFNYERLTPDRFQQFVQALVVRSYPNAQCFPIGQKDGGRDALDRSSADEVIIFQIKFKRERFSNDDPFRLLKPTIDAELPKVKRLAERGATKYILITNLGGTGALDVGSMDRTQGYLEEVLPIAGQMWWRPDIDARLNNEYELRWRFSEILTGTDVLRMLIDESLGEQSRRRRLAIENYMVAQYERDEYVKFKQADLQSSALLSLFIDVPIGPGRAQRKTPGKEDRGPRPIDIVMMVAKQTSPQRNRFEVAGATLLSHPAAQEYFTRAVIEGAPGQGKSTLAQYICQVQRMRFLNRPELDQIPETHRSVPARVPFKVDLRDFALWLQGTNPISGNPLPENTTTSLESFLAAQVQHFSGGQSFSVDDIQLFLSRVPALIFLDGLDEVAPMSDRKSVIEHVSAASSRLRHASNSTQIIVTSRPVASANAPQFSADTWSYFRLNSINEDLVYEYVDRWAAARRLNTIDIRELKQVLRKKLSSTHIKDLARNAMQLTILLNLVHIRGHALPDHRTALYDAYIDIFFNREAEKNQIVLENRQLLIDIHGYLAWRMHSASESRRTGGRVGQETLRDMIADFLRSREYPTDTLDDLLDGVVQRIVALVSRVEGTFEFEVQPLREYFAARHLYDTAPYSPVGDPKRGTKTEIFEAIAPNPYWLNVTRFYAGCYSVGELAGLGNQVGELLAHGDGALTSLPRTIATSLLSDRVFHQAPNIMKSVLERALDNLTIRYAFLQQYSDGLSIELALPRDGGLDEVVQYLVSSAMSAESEAAKSEIVMLLRRLSPDVIQRVWAQSKPENSIIEAQQVWLRVGADIGVTGSLDQRSAIELAEQSMECRLTLLESGHPALLQTASEQRDAILMAVNRSSGVESINGILSQVSRAISWIKYGSLIGRGLFYPGFEESGETLDSILDPDLKQLVRGINSIVEKRQSAEWRLPSVFCEVASIYESALGVTWLSWCVGSACLSNVPYSELAGFECKSRVIGFIVEAAKRRANRSWWRETLLENCDSIDRAGHVLIFCQIATPANVRQNAAMIDSYLTSFEGSLYRNIVEVLRRARSAPLPSDVLSQVFGSGASTRLKVLLGFRAANALRTQLVSLIPGNALSDDRIIADICMEWLALNSSPCISDTDWRTRAQEVARIYPCASYAFAGVGDRFDKPTMPADLARTVLCNSVIYPASFIEIADKVLSESQHRSAKSVGAIARRRRWAANG